MMVDRNVYNIPSADGQGTHHQTGIERTTAEYRQRSFDKFGIKGQLPDEATAVAVGEDVLKGALFTQRGNTITNRTGQASIVDMEITTLSTTIADEMKKPNPNWNEIDSMIRMLAVYLQRKTGRQETEIAQYELDQIKQELKNVLSTYNDKWSLCINIGCGAISIIAGCVGLGAGITGIAQLASGAAKASSLVNTAQGISTAAGSISQGIAQSAGKYVDNSVERKRTFYNYLMQRARDNKDVALQALQAARQGVDSGKSTYDRVNEARHQAIRAIFSSAA